MAYEIISQNNTTTTLTDGEHTIVVPSRVTLATSTSYTITEVNNNTATLEDESGKVIRDVPCVVVLAGDSGGDSHNKGYFATQSALEEAYPTAEAGDWAIVGSTDTVWLWDTDTSAWVDSDQKGQVTSVNGQTGDVTVQATLVNQTNIKSVNGNSLLGAGNLELPTYLTYPAGWTTNGTTAAFCADIAADTTATKGKAYLGEVTLSDLPASMANGEIVVEIMDGTTAADKVIVLSLKSGNVAPYAWQYVYWNNGSNVSGWQGLGGDTLPSQTGNAGKFLTTDGTDASWSAIIDDNSTTSQTTTWSANKLNTTIGNIETLLAQI